MTENTPMSGWMLPQDLATMLQTAYANYRAKVTERASGTEKEAALRELAIIAQAGREKGWPYSELSNPCEMTSERLRQIVLSLKESNDLTEDEETRIAELAEKYPPFTPGPNRKRNHERRKRRTHRSVLTEAERKKLAELAPIARRTSGSTPSNSPVRQATVELSKLIIEYHERGVIWRELAEATGLTEGGIRARASRHGYHQGPPPSIPRYRGAELQEKPRRRRRSSSTSKKQPEGEAEAKSA